MDETLESRSFDLLAVTDEMRFMNLYFDIMKHQYRFIGRDGLTNKYRESIDELFDTCWLFYRGKVREFVAATGSRVRNTIRKEDLRSAFEQTLRNRINEKFKEIEDSVRCTGEDLAPLRSFLAEICKSEPTELDLQIHAHWMWNVKQKLYGRHNQCRYHHLLVWYGPQGSGKSEVLDLFLSPLKTMKLDYEMQEMADSRYDESFQKNLVCKLDELSKGNTQDVEALKRRITAKETSSRRLHTHKVTTYEQNCMFIGTSNRSINEIITDPTGMRRFYQLTTKDKFNESQFKDSEKHNYLKIWQGIDENRSLGYIESYLEQLGEIQQTYVYVDDVESFLTTNNIKPGGPDGARIGVYELYQAYSNFCDENGHTRSKRACNNFTRSLNGKGFAASCDRPEVYYVGTGPERRRRRCSIYRIEPDSFIDAAYFLEESRTRVADLQKQASLSDRRKVANIVEVINGGTNGSKEDL